VQLSLSDPAMNPRLRAAIIVARAADLTIAADRSFAPNRNSLKWNRRRRPAAAARPRRRERVALLTEWARASRARNGNESA
jgi:hypothetical protein